MKIQKSILESFRPGYPLEQFSNLENILFMDIETTGFSPKNAQLYLIGCVFYKEGYWRTLQWLAQRPDEEEVLLTAFFEYASAYKCMIHFNGTTFDLPFLLHKCKQFQLPYHFNDFTCIDLYKRIAPCKYLLKVPDCKQRTLEQYMGLDRKDPFTGGELIGFYQDYVKKPTSTAENAILLHNYEDLTGMLQLLPLLTYYDIFTGEVRTTKVQANRYRDINGMEKQEVLMHLALPLSVPKPVTASANGCYFSASGDRALLKVPVYEEEMKYFYANYKDYYYLPGEDVALHKSVAAYVDGAYRVKATAATCYTRKFSQYLPQWGMLREPFFRRSYKSDELFFELTGELKQDRAAFTEYAGHVLAMIAATY